LGEIRTEDARCEPFRFWVKLRKPCNEQMFSAVLPT
jgi:hypothetical protein